MDVVLDRDGHEIRFRALIDTGAPVTLFDSAIAEALGVRLRQPGGQVEEVFLLGKSRMAERAMVHLTLPPFDDVSWETEVLFLRDELDLAFAGLLGTVGFWIDGSSASTTTTATSWSRSGTASSVRIPVDVFEEFQRNFDSEWQPPGT